MGESRQKRGRIVLQDRVPVRIWTPGDSGRNLGNGVSRWCFLLVVTPKATCHFLNAFNLSQSNIFQTSSQINA